MIMKIGFIGAGNMGSALIKAIHQKKLAKTIIAFDPNEEGIKRLEEFKIKKAKNNQDVVRLSDIIFLAVKPFLIQPVIGEIYPIANSRQLFISIAAGINLTTLENGLPGKKVIRVMPNTPCFVGEMAAGFTLGRECTKEDGILVKKILDAGGVSFPVSEEKLDAVTGLSGSGPAFVAELIQGFIEAGKSVGLDEETSRQLTLQTFLGTAKMLQEGFSEEQLKEMVTTKGGTTEAGRKVLENSDVRTIIAKTIAAATERSKEMGKR